MPASAQRLAIVLSHPTQDYSAWFRWLRANTPLIFRVFYLDESGLGPTRDKNFAAAGPHDVDLTAGYDWEFVENIARRPGASRFFGLRNPALGARIEDWNADAILLTACNHASELKLVAWARRKKIPLILRGDVHLLGRPAPGFVNTTLLGFLYRRFAAIACTGQASRDCFRHYGVPDEKLFHAPYAIDDAQFDPASPAHRTVSLALRVELGLSAHTRVILFAGELTPQNQPRALLEAFLALDPPDTALIFVGEGPEKPEMLARAAKAPTEVNLQFLPAAHRSEMPSRYLLADLFVLPSRGGDTPWGVAVNEAMHLSVPCLVSDHVGCQRDLVTDGETGWIFLADSPASLREKLAAALTVLSRDPATVRAAVGDRVRRFTYEHASAGLLAAFAHATHNSRRAPTSPP